MKEGNLDLIGEWKKKFSAPVPKTPAKEEADWSQISEDVDVLDTTREAIAEGEARLIDNETHEIATPEWPLEDLDALNNARDTIANGEADLVGGQESPTIEKASEDAQFQEIFSHWGAEYSKQEASISPDAAQHMQEEAATFIEAGVPQEDAKGLTFAVDAFMGSPEQFWGSAYTSVPTESSIGEDPQITAWKKEAGERLKGMYTPRQEAPATPEKLEKAEKILSQVITFEDGINRRIPEVHRPFFDRMQDRFDNLEKAYSKCPWWGKALISGSLVGAGLVGAVSGGWLGATVCGISWAGARVASYLGAYSLMRGFTKEENLGRQGLKNAHRGLALGYAVLMPSLLNALGVGEIMSKKMTDWFGAEVIATQPTQPLTAAPLEAPINAPLMESEAPTIRSSIPTPEPPPPVTGAEFGGGGAPEPEMPRTEEGARVEYVEPPAESVRYFEQPVKIKAGDTVWGLIQERLGANGSPADVADRVAYLKSLPAAELKGLGIGPWSDSFKGFLIKPGDVINLSILDSLGAPKGPR